MAQPRRGDDPRGEPPGSLLRSLCPRRHAEGNLACVCVCVVVVVVAVVVVAVVAVAVVVVAAAAVVVVVVVDRFLYSAILRSRAASLRSHVILHE